MLFQLMPFMFKEAFSVQVNFVRERVNSLLDSSE